ncbi:MAG: hypothetical protein FJ000_05200 [Actinobacteria bacterium]|nr:hypothetical protein [Actinomycetota bacterium]
MLTEVIDREREIGQLRELAADPPALVILRGRRRIGKTYLLRVALTGDRVIHFQAEEQPRTLQLEAFAKECSRLIPGAPPLSFAAWADAFRFIGDQAAQAGPLSIALDEFQYLASSDPALVSTIQRFWDQWDSDRTPVMLVLSGSALSFMQGLLTGSRPTFGRSVYRPVLLPLTYRDCAAFAPHGASSDTLVERFAVLGGTPQYQRWAGSRSLARILSETVLPPDAPLHSEPENLIRLEEGIRGPGPYFGVLQAIAEGYTSTSTIAGRLEVKQQLATQHLSRLQQLGYVARVEPLEPGHKGAVRGHWKTIDPYFRFWFRYVLVNRSRLARGRIDEVAAEIREDLPSFTGPVFEDICRDWVGRYSALGDGALEVGSWWSRRSDVEVDVVTLQKKGYGLLGSCKWWRRRVGVAELDDLYRARAALGPNAAQARLVLFARGGFTRELAERAALENVTLVGLTELFDPSSTKGA